MKRKFEFASEFYLGWECDPTKVKEFKIVDDKEKFIINPGDLITCLNDFYKCFYDKCNKNIVISFGDEYKFEVSRCFVSLEHRNPYIKVKGKGIIKHDIKFTIDLNKMKISYEFIRPNSYTPLNLFYNAFELDDCFKNVESRLSLFDSEYKFNRPALISQLFNDMKIYINHDIKYVITSDIDKKLFLFKYLRSRLFNIMKKDFELNNGKKYPLDIPDYDFDYKLNFNDIYKSFHKGMFFFKLIFIKIIPVELLFFIC